MKGGWFHGNKPRMRLMPDGTWKAFYDNSLMVAYGVTAEVAFRSLMDILFGRRSPHQRFG